MAHSFIADLRKNYEYAQLHEHDVDANPHVQLARWFEQTVQAQVPEPNAMTLATVGSDGRPSTRVVLLKGMEEDGLVWYTHFSSRKGRDLAHCPHAALQFHWVELERVVRIEGTVSQVSAAQADAYFESRPLASRLGAWASAQSDVVASREVLLDNEARARAQWGEHPPRPPHWGGYRLKPDMFEFWQGRPSRLHDRLRYRWQAGQWVLERLAP